MSEVETMFSRVVGKAAYPENENWFSRNWQVVRDGLESIGEMAEDAVIDATGLLLDEWEEQQAEIERLRAAEAELFDKCGELQNLVWKLEAARAAGGGDE
jgi:hypothetical protein